MKHYCIWVSQSWSVQHSALGYLTLSGVLAAVMLPLVALVIPQKRGDDDVAREHAVTAIFGSFIFCVTSAFFYGVISGDSLCIRANFTDGPASVLLGLGGSMAIVGICWLVSLWSGDSRLLFRVRTLGLVGILFVSFEVLITIEQMVISMHASRRSWGSWTETLLIVWPSIVLLVSSSALAYRKVRFPNWIRGSFRFLLPACYFVNTAIGTYSTNWSSGHIDKRWYWVAVATAMSLIFTLAEVSLISLLPESSYITPRLHRVSAESQSP